jgi:hypothetical protein
MTAEEDGLRADLEALYPYVEERDRLLEERDGLLERLTAGDERIAELSYQRDYHRWRLNTLKNRRFVRLILTVMDAVRSPKRLLRLPRELVRIIIGPATRPSEPVMPEVVARRSASHRAVADTRTNGELVRRFLASGQPSAVRDLRVAAIMDTFSASCFAPECELIQFRPDNWRATLEARPPHMLMVESAWQGNDGAWQYQVGSYSYPDSTGLPPLTELVSWCRDRDIPTVFWNKEDPVHFDKFKEAAQLFDVVLTTDRDQIGAYLDLPDIRANVVDALPFAAQPALHNPVGAPQTREPIPVFAGTYYKTRHAARRDQLEVLLDAARPFGLQIFDRMHGSESDSVGFPERFVEHVSGGLPYDEMVRAYKGYRVFLNTNSVTESPTMFSRRVFELLASGTPVVSTESLGMEQMLGDVLDTINDAGAATEAIRRLLEDDAHWAARSRAGVRQVMRAHTYEHRLAAVATHAGFDVAVYEPEVTLAMLSSDDPHLFRVIHALVDGGTLGSLLIGADEAFSPTPHPRATRVEQAPGQTDIERYRELAATAGTDWLLLVGAGTDISDDDLQDLIVALRYAKTDVVGVAADGPGQQFVTSLAPSPVLVRRSIVAEHGWTTDPEQAAAHQAKLVAHGHRMFAVDL